MWAWLVRIYGRVMHNGVDGTTPTHLVDRVIYSNWVFLVAQGINIVGALTNLVRGYWLLLAFGGIIQCAFVLSFVLNARHRYLAARMVFLGTSYLWMLALCLVQGPGVQMEHFFLAAMVLAFSMFHPSERRFGIWFAVLSGLAFAVLVNRTGPVIDIDPARGRYTSVDLFMNQFMYLSLIMFSLVGIANAYRRATQLVDEQRALLFEQGRLSSIGKVACSVAHEINTPLTAIDAHLELLAMQVGERVKEQQSVSTLGELSRRIASIVRSFKLISHADITSSMGNTSVGELIRAVADVSAGRLKPLGISLTVELGDPDQRLDCRIVELSQAILNLVGNSIDAVGELPANQRWIRIEQRTTDQLVEISVTDSGHIDSSSTRHRLFEPFFSTKQIGKGTGLGLSVSRRAVEEQGGRLYFEAAAPNTRFVITLPNPVTAADGQPQQTPRR